MLVTLDKVDETDPMLRGILVRQISGGLPEGHIVEYSEERNT